MPARRLAPLAAVSAAALLALAPAAGARTVPATVIAPAAQGDGPAALPILVPRAHGRPVMAVRVAGKRPVRWGSDRLALAQLRPGDRLTVVLDGRRAQRVMLRRSGRADSFARVARALARTGERSRGAVGDLRAITAGEAVDVKRVRNRLSGLMARLMALETDLGTTLGRMRAVRPDAKRRGAAVARAQRGYERRITAVRRRASEAADRTRAAFAALNAGPDIGESGDGTLVPVRPGGGSDLPALPGVVSTASELTSSLQELLTQLGLLEQPGFTNPAEVLNRPPAR